MKTHYVLPVVFVLSALISLSTMANTSGNSLLIGKESISNTFSQPNHMSIDETNDVILKEFIADRTVTKLALGVENNIDKKYDFTPVILGSLKHRSIGIIGDNYQRLSMQVTTAVSDVNKSGLYRVTGTSEVKGNKCDFSGTIEIDSVYLYEDFDYGVDDEYKDKGLTQQGFAVFNYQLNEHRNQKYSGVFDGKLYAKWYTTNDGKMHYDYINYYSDSYFNNLYYGTWSEYGSRKRKVATWADYQLPDSIATKLE